MFNMTEFKEIIEGFHKNLLQIEEKTTDIRFPSDKGALKEITVRL